MRGDAGVCDGLAIKIADPAVRNGVASRVLPKALLKELPHA